MGKKKEERKNLKPNQRYYFYLFLKRECAGTKKMVPMEPRK